MESEVRTVEPGASGRSGDLIDLDARRAAEERHARRSRWQRLRDEARSRPFGYGVLAVFLVAGPFVAAWLFPEAPRAVVVVGGLIFGGYAALCAVPQKFL